MPEEAGKHLCSGPGHGIDEMRINRHPKSSHVSPWPKFARAANPSSPSQPDDAVLLYKLLQKVWELSPTSRIAFACLWCPLRGHLFPISSHLFHLYSSGGTGAPHHFSARGFGRRRFSSPWHITSAHLQQWNWNPEISNVQKTAQDFHSHGGCSLLRKSCSKLASWSAGTQRKEGSLSTDALNTEFNAVWFYKTLMLCPQTIPNWHTGILLFTLSICKPKNARVVMRLLHVMPAKPPTVIKRPLWSTLAKTHRKSGTFPSRCSSSEIRLPLLLVHTMIL